MAIKRALKQVVPQKLFKIIEPKGHLVESAIINALAGFPGKKFKIIGVTGTNGKTSTTFLIHSMLKKAGIKAGIMSTVAYGVDDNIRPQIHHMTNVAVPELVRRLKWMKSEGAEWLVLETTSHALAQNRVWGVPFSVAVMTNVTHEHLDYHGDFNSYKKAKLKLFKITNRNKKGLRIGVINADDPARGDFAGAISNPVLYGLKSGDITAKNINLTPSQSSFTAVAGNENYHITCNLPGSFNISNSLAAVAVGRALGLNKTQIEKGIASLKGVEGRMTNIDEGQNFDVIVDFAHTPDSFEKLLKDLRPVVKGKLIAMFGSAGRRDEDKRAVQGEIAGKYADIVVITEEDDRDVDGQQIMNQIAEGAEESGKKRQKDLFLVHDRTKAIRYSIGLANKGDTVLLLGKGHEKTIERADGEHPWDEINAAHKALKGLVK